MKIRLELMSMMVAGAFWGVGAFAAENAVPAATAGKEVPDCCKVDFLKEPAAKDAAKDSDTSKPAMTGCQKGGMGGCQKGGMGGCQKGGMGGCQKGGMGGCHKEGNPKAAEASTSAPAAPASVTK